MSTKTFTVQLTVQFTALDAEDWDDEGVRQAIHDALNPIPGPPMNTEDVDIHWIEEDEDEDEWEPTHRSTEDGSEVMLSFMSTSDGSAVVENENGDQWAIDTDEWENEWEEL